MSQPGGLVPRQSELVDANSDGDALAVEPAGLATGLGWWPAQTLTGKLLQFVERGAHRLGVRVETAARQERPRPPDFPATVTDRLSGDRCAGLVSIIILNLNGAALLEAGLESLHRINRYPAIQIILVDHASDDASLAVARKWARVLPLTTVACTENHTFAYSCNRAAEFAVGEFLLLLNNDVVLTEDVIGRMVASLQHGASAVGLKLFSHSSARPPNHIGMRFRWNYRYLALQPYNAVPTAADRQIALSPAQFPAVTAAALLCRRSDYLAVGGLCEDYVYGCEDVDLCLKFRARLGRPVICRNDISAIHGEGRTRFLKTPKARRSRWYRHNIAVLERRFGYPMRREATVRLFTDDGAYWGRQPVVQVVPPPSDPALHHLFDTLAQRRRWTVQYAARGDGYNLDAVDLLIVANPLYRLAQVRHRDPHMASIAWIIGDLSEWALQPLETHDLLLADPAADPARLLRERGLRAEMLDPLDAQCAERLAAIVVDDLATGYRLAIKSTGPGQRPFAGSLAGWLRRAGLRVRIDPPGHWHARAAIRDDVAVLLPGTRGTPRCPPLPGTINLVCGGTDRHPSADAHLAMDRPETLAAAIRDAIAAMHPLRLRGQEDPSLAPTADIRHFFADDRSAPLVRSRRLLAGRPVPLGWTAQG